MTPNPPSSVESHVYSVKGGQFIETMFMHGLLLAYLCRGSERSMLLSPMGDHEKFRETRFGHARRSPSSRVRARKEARN
ncbi:hypothetical protein AFLA_004647 [Aspergillus flavus NRRL3357]|nr:hypothetical protein AFLA_004647 [Aspergillus flavus NRRL3357]